MDGVNLIVLPQSCCGLLMIPFRHGVGNPQNVRKLDLNYRGDNGQEIEMYVTDLFDPT